MGVGWGRGVGVGVGAGGGLLPPPPPPYIVRNGAKKCPQARVAFEKGIGARDFSPVQGKVPPVYTSCFLYVVGAF